MLPTVTDQSLFVRAPKGDAAPASKSLHYKGVDNIGRGDTPNQGRSEKRSDFNTIFTEESKAAQAGQDNKQSEIPAESLEDAVAPEDAETSFGDETDGDLSALEPEHASEDAINSSTTENGQNDAPDIMWEDAPPASDPTLSADPTAGDVGDPIDPAAALPADLPKSAPERFVESTRQTAFTPVGAQHSLPAQGADVSRTAPAVAQPVASATGATSQPSRPVAPALGQATEADADASYQTDVKSSGPVLPDLQAKGGPAIAPMPTGATATETGQVPGAKGGEPSLTAGAQGREPSQQAQMSAIAGQAARPPSDSTTTGQVDPVSETDLAMQNKPVTGRLAPDAPFGEQVRGQQTNGPPPIPPRAEPGPAPLHRPDVAQGPKPHQTPQAAMQASFMASPNSPVGQMPQLTQSVSGQAPDASARPNVLSADAMPHTRAQLADPAMPVDPSATGPKPKLEPEHRSRPNLMGLTNPAPQSSGQDHAQGLPLGAGRTPVADISAIAQSMARSGPAGPAMPLQTPQPLTQPGSLAPATPHMSQSTFPIVGQTPHSQPPGTSPYMGQHLGSDLSGRVQPMPGASPLNDQPPHASLDMGQRLGSDLSGRVQPTPSATTPAAADTPSATMPTTAVAATPASAQPPAATLPPVDAPRRADTRQTRVDPMKLPASTIAATTGQTLAATQPIGNTGRAAHAVEMARAAAATTSSPAALGLDRVVSRFRSEQEPLTQSPLSPMPHLSDTPAALRAMTQPGLFSMPELPRHVTQQVMAGIKASPDKSADIVLSPAELGRVRISLQSGEGGIIVQVIADRPETLDLLRRNADLLAQDFHDIGFGSAEFTFGQDQQAGAQNDTAGGHGPAGKNAPLLTDPTDAAQPLAPQPRNTVALDRVDLRL